MKSRLFRRFDPRDEENKEFVKDLTLAVGLTESQQKLCANALVPYLFASVEVDERRILEDLEEATKLPRTSLACTMQAMAFFLRQAVKPEIEGDKPEDWAADLRSSQAGILKSDEEQAAFVAMTEEVLQGADAYRHEQKVRAYATGVLPMFKSCGHTVELRAVQHESYKWGQAIDEYAPDIIGQVPIISIHIGTDSKSTDYNFQMREDQLKYLIDELESARVELSAFRRYLAVKE